MQVRLEVSHKKANVKQVVLRGTTLVGRNVDCDLRIASNQVSRRHCQITLCENAVLIRDLKSSNGTFVNGERIPPDQDVVLFPGTRVTLGPLDFVVHFEPPAEPLPPPASTVELPVAGPPDSNDAPPTSNSEASATEPNDSNTTTGETPTQTDGDKPFGSLFGLLGRKGAKAATAPQQIAEVTNQGHESASGELSVENSSLDHSRSVLDDSDEFDAGPLPADSDGTQPFPSSTEDEQARPGTDQSGTGK